jgi:signal transduction histidine kinase
MRWLVSALDRSVPNAAFLVGGYVAIYVLLDCISFFAVLPGTSFTPWNPPPAASIALLVNTNLRFAPALFVAGMISEVAVANCPLGILATFAMESVTTAGYAGVAAALRRFVRARQGLPRVVDVVRLLFITATGTFVVAACAIFAAAITHGVPWSLSFPSIWHYFIGDLTGIIGLLPVLLSASRAWERWKEVPPATRALDLGVFVLGLAFALFMVFGVARSKEPQFLYLLLPPVAWIAVRHGVAWCAVAILIEQLALVSMIAWLDHPGIDFLAYQVLSLATAATGLILGAVVTERQRTELYLRQQQAELYRAARLSTAGAFGAAVVHEISQPLATIATYAHICRTHLAVGPAASELLDGMLAKLESEVRRAGDVVERIRDFLSKGAPQWSRVDLTKMARKLTAVLADVARPHGVAIRIDARLVPQVAADVVQIEQVLVNLIRNAIEAAADVSGRDKWVRVHLRHVDHEIELAVEDNGRGVPDDLVERLFRPFETSKQRGMGLGLSLSREIVEAHGGRLWYDSKYRPGARFLLRLPCDQAEHR